SAAPATRLNARAFTGTFIWLLPLSQDTCHSCFRDHVLQATASEAFLGMVRIAAMSRRRAKCIVSIAGHRSARYDVQKNQNHVQKKQHRPDRSRSHRRRYEIGLLGTFPLSSASVEPTAVQSRLLQVHGVGKQWTRARGTPEPLGAHAHAPAPVGRSGPRCFPAPSPACFRPPLPRPPRGPCRCQHWPTTMRIRASRRPATDRAIADFSEAIRLAPNYAEAYYNRAHAYRAKKDNDRAIADYSETIRLDPRAANVWYDRANAYLDKDNYDRAIADYTEALRLNPNDTAALVNRGIAYRDKGQYDQAIEDHDRAIRL